MKGMGGHQSRANRTNDWITPKEIIMQLGEFDLDPCASLHQPWATAKHHYTINDNGLIKEWFGRVWLNPPYTSELIEKFMELMANHNNGIALTFARTDTDVFHKYVFPYASSLLFIKRRIVFCNTGGMKGRYDGGAPSVLIAYGQHNSDVLADTKIIGAHIPVNYTPMIIIGISPTWISVVSIAVKQVGDEELRPIYEVVEKLAPDKVAKNQHWKAKIRQTIQVIRKKKKHDDSFTLKVD